MFEISRLSGDKFKVWSGRRLIAICKRSGSELQVIWGHLNDIGLGIITSIIHRERLALGI